MTERDSSGKQGEYWQSRSQANTPHPYEYGEEPTYVGQPSGTYNENPVQPPVQPSTDYYLDRFGQPIYREQPPRPQIPYSGTYNEGQLPPRSRTSHASRRPVHPHPMYIPEQPYETIPPSRPNQYPDPQYSQYSQPPMHSVDRYGRPMPTQAYDGYQIHHNLPQPVNSSHYNFNPRHPQDRPQSVQPEDYYSGQDVSHGGAFYVGPARRPEDGQQIEPPPRPSTSYRTSEHWPPPQANYDSLQSYSNVPPGGAFYVGPGRQQQQQQVSPTDGQHSSTNERPSNNIPWLPKEQWKENLKRIYPDFTKDKLEKEWKREKSYRKHEKAYLEGRLHKDQRSFMKDYRETREMRDTMLNSKK